MSQPPPDMPPPEEPPGPPGQPPIGPIPPEAPGVPEPAEPAEPGKPSRAGGHMGAGAGFGCLGLIVAVFLAGTLAGAAGNGWVPVLLAVAAVTIAGVALMIPKRTRRVGLGFTIVVAAFWIVIIGPCALIISGGSFL